MRSRVVLSLSALVAGNIASCIVAFSTVSLVSQRHARPSLTRNLPKVTTAPSELSTSSSSSSSTQLFSWRRRLLDRFDTVQSANLPPETKTAGVWGKIKKLHDPISYIALAAVAGFRYDWCFRSPYYWFVVGFFIKWYRARYVYKVPVWDRQPNWNNIITSKEQEKDLKAFTCKNCGSTIFIAKSREFFFEGDTGIGGLGCFSCGAKGKDNFVMDRERIVEDVADMDDYFDYERPLDFVSRAERRKLLQEADGDEERANQLLMERSASTDASPSSSGEETVEKAFSKDESPSLDAPTKKKKSSKKKAAFKDEKKNKNDKNDDDDDILDALDMDAL